MKPATWTVSLAALGVVAGLLPPAGARASSAPTSTGEFLSYQGIARDHDSRAFAYGEQHFVRLGADGPVERIVLYTCADRRPFARKLVSYAPARAAPDFALEDAASGVREGVRTRSGERTAFFRSSAQADEASARVDAVAGLVVDAGFDEFVRERWEALLRGERVRLEFLVPSRLHTVSFKVRRLRSERIGGRPAEVMRLGLSGMWAFIAPHIDVYYDRDQRVLLRYEGVSNLRNAAGDNHEVRIEFPPGLRALSQDPAPMQGARRAPLVSSCR